MNANRTANASSMGHLRVRLRESKYGRGPMTGVAPKVSTLRLRHGEAIRAGEMFGHRFPLSERYRGVGPQRDVYDVVGRRERHRRLHREDAAFLTGRNAGQLRAVRGQ